MNSGFRLSWDFPLQTCLRNRAPPCQESSSVQLGRRRTAVKGELRHLPVFNSVLCSGRLPVNSPSVIPLRRKVFSQRVRWPILTVNHPPLHAPVCRYAPHACVSDDAPHRRVSFERQFLISINDDLCLWGSLPSQASKSTTARNSRVPPAITSRIDWPTCALISGNPPRPVSATSSTAEHGRPPGRQSWESSDPANHTRMNGGGAAGAIDDTVD